KQVHGFGLSFGLYTCAGPLTCEKRPGSFGFEDIDAETYAGWGVDYVKVDWCSAEEMNAKERYGVFRDAIAKSGRPMLLSICNWGFQDPWIWGPETGAMWRTSGDIKDNILLMSYTLLSAEPLAAFARVGHWNDPDMLEVGNGGMTTAQYRAHFSLWAVLAAPLLAGNDLRDMSQDTLDILLNAEVIAVDQDPAGLQGVVVRQDGPVKSYARPLTGDGLRAVVLYNTDLDSAAPGKISWTELGLEGGKAEVRDLWAHQDLGSFEDGYEVDVPPAATVMIRVAGREPLPPHGELQLEELRWKYSASFDKSLRKGKNGQGGPLKLDGQVRDSGIGAVGAARLVVHLGHRCTRFEATVGVDDAALEGGGGGQSGGSVTFEVRADGDVLFQSGVVTTTDDAVDVSADLTGRRELELLVSPAADSTAGDLADWADARLTCGH
ncbi:MAG: alpha-galactosidase, partial [Deltaproteobacteria bacterium]|nr:alpha-galactosidase [Deltaproteobacteria bacterium]